MTRITYGIYRKGVREPGFTLSSTLGGSNFPTPMTTAASAVARFHRNGARSALRYLEGSFAGSDYWGPSGTPQARGWAAAIVSSFEQYIRMAEHDGRTAFAVDVRLDVAFDPHVVGVHVDAVLLDDEGYLGRVALWDRAAVDEQLATHYATPALTALEELLGEGRVAGVQIWHLRSGDQFLADRDACIENLDTVGRMVGRIAR